MQRATSLRLTAFAGLCALAAGLLYLAGWDRPGFLALDHAAARYLPAALPSSLTLLGNGLAATALLAPCLRRAPSVLVAALYAAPVGAVFSRVGKWLAERPRPAAVLDAAQIDVQGPWLSGHNSFPSGHSLTIFLAATVLVLGAESVRARPLAVLGVLGLAVLVAASRVMVGAHWPSDTLGGAALGTLAGLAGTWAAARWPWFPLTRWRHAPALRALVVLACAVALGAEDTGYPLAQAAQWCLAALGAACALDALLAAARGAAPPAGAARP
jgi:membrane-associated phospholipid phosphatase